MDRLKYVALFFLLSACGGSDVGTRFLAEISLTPAGGELLVTAERSPTLAGTRIVFPPNAVAETTTVALAPLLESLVSGDAAVAGPGIAITPAGLELAVAAELTLPVTIELDSNASFELHRPVDDAPMRADPSTGSSTTVTAAILELDRYQPAWRSAGSTAGCESDSQCSDGEWCVDSVCLQPSPGACRTAADCAEGSVCENPGLQGRCRTQSPVCGFTLVESDLDFGLVAEGESVMRSFSVRGGDFDLELGARIVDDASQDFVLPSEPLFVGAGETATFDIVFTPTLIGTTQIATVEIAQGEICRDTLQLVGEGRPPEPLPCGIEVAPNEVLDFGSAQIGAVATREVSVSAVTDLAAEITIAIAGSDAFANNSGTLIIPAGESIGVPIEFVPFAITNQSGLITVADSVSGCSAQITVVGSGDPGECFTTEDCPPQTTCVGRTLSFRGTCTETPCTSGASVSALDFGVASVGQSQTRTLTLDVLGFPEIGLDLGADGEFSVALASVTQMGAGRTTAEVDVTFAPTEVRDHERALLVFDSSACSGFAVPIRGTSVP
ncbi:MAG: choice-of-anchor D domain-containing protein [Myxococcota bacterium]